MPESMKGIVEVYDAIVTEVCIPLLAYRLKLKPYIEYK